MQLQKHNLERIWNALTSKYCSDKSLVAAFYEELVDHYQEPQRYYHNLDHIKALLQLYFQYEKILNKPYVVLFSIFYHDVIYVPGRADNESRSARQAGRVLEQLGVHPGIIADVQLYIMTTSSHKLPPSSDQDLKLFVDFDLSILAAERESYREYLLKVRKEYGHLSTDDFIHGRRAFLQQILCQEEIFYSDSFRPKEEAARKNMQWELQIDPGIYSAL